MLKGNVPLFDEEIDPTDPAAAGQQVGGMAFGVFVALVALAIGAFGFERVQDMLGQDTSDTGVSFEVA